MILTTHYLDEAEQLADRVGVIAGGRLLDVDTTERLGGAELRTPLVRWREGGPWSSSGPTTRPRWCCRWPHASTARCRSWRSGAPGSRTSTCRCSEADAASTGNRPVDEAEVTS